MIPADKTLELSRKIQSILDEAYQCRLNDLTKSIKLSKEALELSVDIGDKSLEAKSLSLLALFFMITGDFDQSMKMSNQAIAYFRELGDEKGVADAKYNIAGLYYKTDNFHTGLAYLLECLPVYRKFGDYHNQSRVLKSIGTIYEYFGDQKSAIASYEQSIEAAQLAGDISIESNVYNPLSGVYLNQGKVEDALELIEKSIGMKEESEDIRGLAFALYGRGKVYTEKGQYDLAESDLKRSIEIHLKMGEKIGLGMSYHKLGLLYKEKGDVEEAKKMLAIALDFGHSHNISWVKYKCNHLLYELAKSQGNLDEALQYLEVYIKEKDVVINTQTFKLIESYEAIMRVEAMQREAQIQKEKAEIIEKKNLAEKASKMKEDFLSTMSHEIRTPLNAVITIASLLKDRSVKTEKQLLDSLKFSANNLLLIINDILDFTKLDSGKVKLEPHSTNLTNLIDKIKNTYSSMAEEKGLKLIANVEGSVGKSYIIDEVKLSQILGNLISNAIKFTESGKIDIEVEKLSEYGESHKLRFTVRDTGVGIPKEDIGLIFDSFSQPKHLTTREEGGSGLGLAIVKKLLRLHKSDILVTSKVGEGSEFRFDLVFKTGKAEHKTSRIESSQLQGLKVLVVDDMMINAMVAGKLLSNWGMDVDHVNNGIEAVEKTKDQLYDYILMDIHMPVMDGYEATKIIRKNDNINHETPIIALTADITADQRELYTPYFNDFMLKPIEQEKLYNTFMAYSPNPINQV